MALMSYLLKDRHGTYYFRRVIPPALRPFMPAPWNGKANWKRSLATKKPAEAKLRAARALAECTRDFQIGERARDGGTVEPTLDAQFIAGIAADSLSDLLARDETEREEGDDRRRLQTAEERAVWPDLMQPREAGAKGMEADHFEVYGDMLEELEGEYRRALARRDPGIVEAELRDRLRQRGRPVDPTAPGYREAGLALLQAHVKGFGLMRQRQAGDDVPTPQPAAASAGNRGPALSEAYEAWKAGSPARGTRKPGSNTIREADHAVRRFRELHGDLPLGDITREKAREFRDALAQVPTRLPSNLRPLPIRDIIANPATRSLPAPHGNTINKSLAMLGAIVSAAERDGRLDGVSGFVNPFGRGLRLSVDQREAEGRHPFTAADLKAIFGSPVYAKGLRPAGGGGEAAYWLPLIALLTGARQGELAQLRVQDLAKDPETSLWFFDIGTGGGRSIKTASSRRRVPLHPELERLGLLRYREGLAAANRAGPEASLWPDIRSDSVGRRAGPWSKWFNRYLRDAAAAGAGIEEGGKVFHSFRHSFKRLARDAGLSEELHDAITGHQSGGGVGRSYGSGFGLKALADALGKVKAPEAVRKLAPWLKGPHRAA